MMISSEGAPATNAASNVETPQPPTFRSDAAGAPATTTTIARGTSPAAFLVSAAAAHSVPATAAGAEGAAPGTTGAGSVRARGPHYFWFALVLLCLVPMACLIRQSSKRQGGHQSVAWLDPRQRREPQRQGHPGLRAGLTPVFMETPARVDGRSPTLRVCRESRCVDPACCRASRTGRHHHHHHHYHYDDDYDYDDEYDYRSDTPSLSSDESLYTSWPLPPDIAASPRDVYV